MLGHRKRRQFKQTDAFTRGMVIGLKRAGWSIRQIAADTHLGASTVHRLWRRWLEQGNVAIYRNVGATRVTSARVDRHHSISTRTISRRLVANGLHSCRPLRRLSLTPPNRRQRLEWCRARSMWMTEWHRVVFSDESRFCLSSDSRRVRVWRRRGERSNPAAIVERPTVRQHASWPPYSPDLSPIEHVWDIIGCRLHALPQPRSEDELWQMVEREWRAIPQDAIRTLIDSLPRRVAACIAVRGTNYPIWALKVESLLRGKKLFKCVISDPEPDIKDEVAWQIWSEKNDEAFGIIVTTLSDEQAGMFLDETKAKKVWDELKKIYTGNLEVKIIDIGLELKNIKMKNNESINEYMARTKNIASQSSSLGHQISQRELAFHIVRGIHPRLEKIAVVLRTRRELTLDEIRQSLREEENRMNSKMNGSHSDENEQAYRSKDRRNHYQQNRQKECFVCHKKGHLAKDCWFKNKRTQEKHGRINANSNTNYNKQNFRNNANTVSSKPVEQTFNTSTDRVFENSSNNYSQIQTWCLVSGCTTHLSPHLDWMENVMPYESEINLAEEGKVTHATAKGDIKVSTCTENGIENVQIKGVLHVPNLRSNLLSIYELTNKGNTVIFNRDGAKIYNEQDDLIEEAQIQDRMYVMETRSRDEYSEKTENVMTTKDDFSNDNISLWHRRLNHLNEAYMKEIIQRNVVLRFNVKFKNLPECETCIMGKLTRQPSHPVTTNCTTKPLEMVHMDLCGPMPYQSLGGSKYFFVLVDDFSRRTFIYFLKSKDETLGKFEEFKARVENELNLKIKDVRTDNGTEFTNHRLKNFLIKNGIHHQLSNTYSPQKNRRRSVKFVENEKGIDYAKNLQEDTNYDHFAYKKEEENDIEIDLRTRPETSELNEETIPTLDEPNEERIVRSGRKKGDTQKVLEEKHRAKLREGEMKLLEQGVRRSQIIKERNNVNFLLEPEERLPENYEEAINCENKYEWLEAMKEELYSINKHKVWTLVQREKNMKIINCKWIFSIKSTPGEGVYRRKARLVAIGCNQKYGVEYEESFSPVIRKEILREIVALAAQLNLVITSYDVKTTYLYGELKETLL
ncbi:hypothetical protein LAZ67_13002273 [Cordylochernes scorpioides]|uniref:Retrovirus-related Pol polyprotein from transposon TNT 1-94 n=1 Tax=Cordylochernes scorpioides TaxID=51811 RepID=A0ABY6L6Z1_9ARAC|nr:hypothetical protein LAZ67_13002273 [Cordylochernes scorpioides]